MIATLLYTDQFLWVVDIISFLLIFGFVVREQRLNSTFLTVVVVVLLDGAMHQYTMDLYYAEFSMSLYQLKFIVWYVGFALFDALGLYLIYKAHKVINIKYNFIARMALLQYFVLGQLQLTACLERLLWGTKYLNPIYQAMIPATNIATSALMLGFILIISYSKYINNKKGNKVKWQV